MAVQAQYPSNVLLNNRNLVTEGNNNHQLGNDYSLQPQPGGGFLHQPHLLFNNFGAGICTNPRKRGREVNSNATTTTTATATATANKLPINHQFMSSIQQQQSQLIDLTQLHSHPSQNVVSTGLRLTFNDQQQQQQQLHHHQHQQNHQNSLSLQSSVVLSLLSEDLSSQIKHQRDEIEHFIQSQAEELRRTLAEKRHRHYRALMGAAEESVARRLREKEAEVEKASRRNAELEARAAQLSAEAQVWQATARAQEVTAATLQAQLQQAIVSGGCAGNNNDRGGEDAETGGTAAEDAESAYIDPDRVVEASGPGCKACGKRVASVVLLPCRHLCVCTGCDSVVQACPLCLTFRSSSVEVFLS